MGWIDDGCDDTHCLQAEECFPSAMGSRARVKESSVLCSRTGPGLSQIWRRDRSGALCGGALPKVSSGAAARAYVHCCILVKLRHALSTVLYGREVAPFRSRLQGGILVDTDFRSHSVAIRSALYIAVPAVRKPSHSSSPVISVKAKFASSTASAKLAASSASDGVTCCPNRGLIVHHELSML